MVEQLLVWPPLALLIALPALAAWRRRSLSREVSSLAADLADRAEQPLDDALWRKLERLRLPELAVLRLAEELAPRHPALIQECAQRLALRLRRRVAFERKMLARTASGLRRGAIAASAPPVAVLLWQAWGVDIPVGARAGLLLADIFGCVLLWRLARVEI